MANGKGKPKKRDKPTTEIISFPKRLKILPLADLVPFPHTNTQVRVIDPSLAEAILTEQKCITVYLLPGATELPDMGTLTLTKELARFKKGKEVLISLDLIQRVSIRDAIPQKVSGGKIYDCLWEIIPEHEVAPDIWKKTNCGDELAKLHLAFSKLRLQMEQWIKEFADITTKEEQAQVNEIIQQGKTLQTQVNRAGPKDTSMVIDQVAEFLEDTLSNALGTLDFKFLTVMQDIFLTLPIELRLQKLAAFTVEISNNFSTIVADDETEEHEEEEEIPISRSEGPDPFEERYRKIKDQLPQEVKKEIEQERERIRRKMHPSEASMARDHIGLLLDLFSLEETADNADIHVAERILNEDHWGLEQPKERILEHLAVRKHVPKGSVDIICFVGPAGVGKTSLGKSIARALGRKFGRFSLGGLRDEAEIRGHGLTYIRTQPGRIIKSLLVTGSKNPVLMLDEVDKISKDLRGDPAAALLEVLDPEQNKEFLDLNVNIPFDLSRVFFICTANSIEPIPEPLLDRMELIELPGYTMLEKRAIAKHHLIPKTRAQHGIPLGGDKIPALEISFSDGALVKLIEEYTQEAGVRQLQRIIARVYRRIIKMYEQGELKESNEVQITQQNLHIYAGRPQIHAEVRFENMPPGCVPMFAVSDSGGHFFYVETNMERGRDHRKIKVTGVRGSTESRQTMNNLIEESVDLALDSLVLEDGILYRSLQERKSEGDYYIHVHIKNGATPKDGPSAGIPMLWAMYGLLTKQSIAPNIGATGEIDLRLGAIGAVGGIRDKVLAAYRAGIKTFVLPRENEQDLEEVPNEIKTQMKFHALSSIGEALALAFPNDERLKKYFEISP